MFTTRSLSFSVFIVAALLCCCSMQSGVSAQTTTKKTVLPYGLYCGGNKTVGVKAILQVSGVYAALRIQLPAASPKGVVPQACEMQFLVSQHSSSSSSSGSNNKYQWTAVSFAPGQACDGITAPQGFAVKPSVSQIAGAIQGLGFYLQTKSLGKFHVMLGGKACETIGMKVAPWIPSGTYCDNVIGSEGLFIKADRTFEFDIKICVARGNYVLNTSTGDMKIIVDWQDPNCPVPIAQVLTSSSFNSKTGVMTLSGSLMGESLTVSATRTLCSKPVYKNPLVAKQLANQTFCGQTQDSAVNLRLGIGHVFTLSVGLCTSQGLWQVTKKIDPKTSKPVFSVNLVFYSFVDCLSNVTIASLAVKTNQTLAMWFVGGETTGLTKELAVISTSVCDSNSSSTVLPPGSFNIPQGQYCIAPISNTLIPPTLISLAIFSTNRFQLWAGGCEAHGYFSVGYDGVVTIKEEVRSSTCPATVKISAVKWNPLEQRLVVSVLYTGLTLRVSVSQSNCPKLNKIGVTIPSGLYCQVTGKTAQQQLTTTSDTRLSVVGNLLDLTISNKKYSSTVAPCTIQGPYSLFDNSQVKLNITSISNCMGIFFHTITYMPQTITRPATVRFAGLDHYNNSFNFTTVNCSHPATSSSSNQLTSRFYCFKTANGKQSGFVKVGFGDYVQISLGACIVRGRYTINVTGGLNWKTISRNDFCVNKSMGMKLTGFSSDASQVSIGLKIKKPLADGFFSNVIQSTPCPTTTLAPPTTAAPTTFSVLTTAAPTAVSTSSPQQTQAPTTTASPPPAVTPAPSTNAPAVTTQAPASTPSPAASTPSPAQPTSAPATSSPPASSQSPPASTPTPAPPTTTTLTPTLAIGTYTFTANSLSGQLTVAPSSVALKIGSCGENGTLQETSGNSNKYKFVASSQDSGCSSTSVSNIEFAQSASSGSSSPSVEVSGSVNGATFSAAAAASVTTGTTAPSSPDDKSGNGGVIAAVVVGVLVVVAVAGFLYMRKKGARGTGQAAEDEQDTKNTAFHMTPGLNAEMISSGQSQYQNYKDDRSSTHGGDYAVSDL